MVCWVSMISVAWAAIEFPLKYVVPKGLLVTEGDASGDENFGNPWSYYQIEFDLGAPPQRLEAILDIGSSDFIVPTPYTRPTRDWKELGLRCYEWYTSGPSWINGTFYNQTYANGEHINGTWIQDVASIGGTQIGTLNFVVASYLTGNISIAGIGPPSGESPLLRHKIQQPYVNLPMLLKNSGIISNLLYSIWLADSHEEKGSILFGAIDTARYSGDLYRFKLVNRQYNEKEKPREFKIILDAIFLHDISGDTQLLAKLYAPIKFDTTTSITRLPYWVIEYFYESIGVDPKKLTVPCPVLTNGGSLSLVFSGVQYTFPFKDIVVTADEFGASCIPGVLPGDQMILGINFMRHLYMVFDIENSELGLAMVKTLDAETFKDFYYIGNRGGGGGKGLPFFTGAPRIP